MTRIAIIVGTTRPNRRADKVADWVHKAAASRGRATYELVDIADFDLPNLDEAVPARAGAYRNPHTRSWAAEVARYDGFVFVTPEYNHSISGSLKNAIDFLGAEWGNKAAGFVGYGVAGGTRAVEHLRLILAELEVATVRAQVSLSLFEDFEGDNAVSAADHQHAALDQMLDQLEAWAGALIPLRG